MENPQLIYLIFPSGSLLGGDLPTVTVVFDNPWARVKREFRCQAAKLHRFVCSFVDCTVQIHDHANIQNVHLVLFTMFYMSVVQTQETKQLQKSPHLFNEPTKKKRPYTTKSHISSINQTKINICCFAFLCCILWEAPSSPW